jgi:hypothetical protein
MRSTISSTRATGSEPLLLSRVSDLRDTASRPCVHGYGDVLAKVRRRFPKETNATRHVHVLQAVSSVAPGATAIPSLQKTTLTYQTGLNRRHSSVYRSPIRHDVTLKTQFVFQKAIERLAVLAAITTVDALVGAHDRSSACSHSIGEWP